MRVWIIAPLAVCVLGAPQAPAIPFTTATVASTDGQTDTISWTAAPGTTVTVYAGIDPSAIGREHLVGRGGATGQVLAHDLPPTPRWYFELVPSAGRSLVIADRNLHLTTAPNFRDAGGYRTTDGRWVRMGLLYRSDQLDQLGELDLQTLVSDHVHLVCDLRTDNERARGADRLPIGATPLIADVLAGDNTFAHVREAYTDSAKERELLGNGGGRRLMMQGYRGFVMSPGAQRAYRTVFTRLADPAALPGVFHCAGGKDRTGWAEAVFLTALGVPRQTITDDYLLTNSYLRAKRDVQMAHLKPGIDPTLLEPILKADSAFLNAGFDEVRRRYGSFDRYLRDGLQLDDATLRALRAEFLTG
jgi:protein-tyrosine phosphatase